MNRRYRILFVCMGNICRSPIAEAVTRSMAQDLGLAAMLEVDSAGTHGHYHAGEAPDARARRIAAKRGYDLSRLRARTVVEADFDRFDRILAMDEANLSALLRICPPASRAQVGLFLDCCDGLVGGEIPDPYYGAESGFERVIDLCERAAKGLLADLARGEPER
ncbi:MAG: low molecular weight protein-tyrosine-phosphatase [Candidatus Accumulibacter sp. UW26]|jgi:protein-tyrosine phosphatase